LACSISPWFRTRPRLKKVSSEKIFWNRNAIGRAHMAHPKGKGNGHVVQNHNGLGFCGGLPDRDYGGPGRSCGAVAGTGHLAEPSLRSNGGTTHAFRQARMRKECDPITDSQLHAQCIASFSQDEPAMHSSSKSHQLRARCGSSTTPHKYPSKSGI
jgi:hypothetical protein